MTRAMLLCAGLGTRLGKMGAERPKPMLPVCGVPILEYGIANLVAHGITELVINTHHRSDVIEQEIGDGRRLGARIRYSHEEILLGTGGGLKHALPLLDPDGRDEPFLSLNGKLIFDLDLAALLDAYRAASAASTAADPLLGMMVVRHVPDAKAWGAVDVRAPAADDRRGPWIADILGDGHHMFCGVHVTRPSVVSRLPHGEACMIRQGYLPWLHAGGRVAAWTHERGYFAEHSTPQRYLESNWALLENKAELGLPLRHPPAPVRGIDPTATIHADATIVEPVRICADAVINDGAVIGPNTVVGPGAQIGSGIELVRSVVWRDVQVTMDADAEIVTGS